MRTLLATHPLIAVVWVMTQWSLTGDTVGCLLAWCCLFSLTHSFLNTKFHITSINLLHIRSMLKAKSDHKQPHCCFWYFLIVWCHDCSAWFSVLPHCVVTNKTAYLSGFSIAQAHHLCFLVPVLILRCMLLLTFTNISTHELTWFSLFSLIG